MDVKRQLQEYSWIVKNIELMEERLLELDTDLQRATARLSDMPKAQGSPDKITLKVADIIDLQNEINEEVQRRCKKEQEIKALMGKLDEREQVLVRLKYVKCLTWEQCAVEMNYGWQHLHKIHKNLLRKLNRR